MSLNKKNTNKRTFMIMVVIIAVMMFAIPAGTANMLQQDGSADTTAHKTVMATWTGGDSPDWTSLGYEVVIDYGNSALVKVSEDASENKNVILNDVDSMNTITTDAGRFDPKEVDMNSNHDGLKLVQMKGPVKPDWKGEMEEKGAQIISYLPNNAYLVDMGDSGIGSLDFVREVISYGSELRAHPDLMDSEEEVQSINVLVDPDSNARDMLPTYVDEYGFFFSLNSLDVYSAKVKTDNINKMKEIPGLVWMEPFNKPELNDEKAVELVGGEFEGMGAKVNNLGFTGEGITVAVTDSGIDDGTSETMHPDLKGRVKEFLPYGYASDAGDGLGHGTHCAGIIAGNAATERTDSNGYYYGSGVAPETELVAQKIFRDSGSFLNPNMDKLASEAVNNSALISSNSWGAAIGGQYDAMAAAFDNYTRDADIWENGSQPLTYVFSAGNSGPDSQTIGSPGTAKNVITVGASENDRPGLEYFDSDNPEEVAFFSSRGPTVDGRIKPDITAPGSWVASALSSSAPMTWAQGTPDGKYYEWASGTSMAAPHVSGGAALFGQYYQNAYDEKPTPSLIKAALINGAVNLEGGRFGGKAPVPNNEEGWGMMDLTNTLPTDETVDYVNRNVKLETGDVYTKNVDVTSEKPLKITMAYSDVAAAPNANPTLVNNLNLIVRGPNGQTYVGNAMSNGWSDPSIKATDNLNNLENVFIKDPVKGTYTVTVHGASVPQDAIDSTSEVDQDFSLVVRGKFNGQSVGNVKVDKDYYAPGETLNIELSDSDLNKDTSAVEEVTVSVSSGRPDAENVVLTETGVDEHIFTGSIELKDSIAHIDDGILQVNKVDDIEVVYNDNNPTGRRDTSAVVDSVSPVISDTKVVDPTPTKVNVSWNTNELTTGKIYYKPAEADSWNIYQEGRGTEHKVVLEDLERNMPYELYITAKDKAGNKAVDDNDGNYYTFKTEKAAPVLLVDDGGEGWTGKYDYQKYLEWSLDNTSYEYEVWDHIDKGTPSLSDLRVRDVVIWHTGRAYGIDTLNSQDEQVLSEYLEHNGKLFLSSSKYMQDVGVTPFAEEYLAVDSQSYPMDLSYNVTGVNGDPITDRIGKLNISFPYSKYFADTGHIWPNQNGSTIFTSWYDKPTAIRTNNSDLPYRSVFFGFPFESIAYENGRNGSMVMNNVMNWLNPGQDHDVQVQGLEISKDWAKPGDDVGIEAAIFNNGNNIEKDVQVNIKLGDTVIKSKTISSLEVDQSKFVSTNITAQGDGEKSITIDITPVKYENETADNKWSEPLYVRTPQDPIKVVLVDSLGNYRRWGDIESQWYKYSNHPFEFDTKSLTHQDITYSDIAETNADMLMISDAWRYSDGWEFSDAEVDAISDYVASGHPIIATSGTFNYDLAPNNQELAPIFGLKEDAHGSWGFGDELKNPFTVLDPDHPMFDGIPESYMPGDPSAASGLRVADGNIKARSLESSWFGPDKKYLIVTNKHENGQAFYFSHFPESADASAQDKRLICNSIVYGYQNSTTPEHDITVRKQKVPDWVEYGAQAEFKARVYNTGSNTESDVEIKLNVDGTVRDTKIVSTLEQGNYTDVTLKYTPADHGKHEIKINSTQLNGETITINNNATDVTYVRTYQGELTVAPVDCYANEFIGPQGIIEEIEGEWYKYGNYSMNFDLDALHSFDEHYKVTYDRLVQSKADVLLLSNNAVFEHYIFSESEVSAIENYTKDGGAVVATGDTFIEHKMNNNTKMLDVFGLTHGSYYKDYLYVKDGAAINLTKPNHPVFTNVNDPYQPGPVIKKDYTGEYMPGTKTEVASDIGVGDATVIANTTLRSGRILNITEHKSGLGQTVYSDYSVLHNGRPGYTPDQDKQFLYNMLKFAYDNTTFTPGVSHEAQEYASTGEAIPVEANIYDKDDGISSATLYYKNVGDTSYSSKSMTMTSGDLNDGMWYAEIPAQSSGGEVEYYIEAEDKAGHVTKMPHGAPDRNFTTTIDVQAPIITHTSPGAGLIGQQIPITAEVTEGSAISSVVINYVDVEGEEHSDYMIYTGGDNFTAYLPAQDSLGQITYTIEATDINRNTASTSEYQLDVGGQLLTVNVVDRDGDAISQLTGTLTNERTSESTEITTSSDGSYVYPLTNLDSGYETGDVMTAEFSLNGEQSTSSTTIDQIDGTSTLTVQFDQEITDSESPAITDNSGEVIETGNTYTMTAEITDNREVSEVYVEYWTDVTNKVNRTMPSSGTTYELSITVPTDAQELSYKISAVDNAGNWNNVESLGMKVDDVIAPTADVTAQYNLGVGEEGTFNASKSTDNIAVDNYTWTIGGVQYYGESITHSFDTVGSHEVTLTVTDAEGNMDEEMFTVQVTDTVAPEADAGSDVTVEMGDTVDFDASGSSDNVGIESYVWTIGDTELTGVQPNYTFEHAGEYEITLTVEDGQGNVDQDKLIVTVEDTQKPTADAGSFTMINMGQTVTLQGDGSSDNVGITSYEWSFEYEGKTVTLTGMRPTYTFNKAGRTTVTLTVTDAAGNTATDTVDVQIKDTEYPIADAGQDITVGMGEELTLDASGSSDNVGITSYVWDIQGETVKGETVTHTFDEPGQYTVELEIQDGALNTATDELVISVEDTQKPTADAGDDVTIGIGSEGTLDASGSSDNVGISSYEWTVDGQDVTGEVVSQTMNEVGTYTATLTVTDQAGNTATDEVTVEVIDDVKPEADAEDINIVKEGDEITLDAEGSADNLGIQDYKWTIDGEKEYTGKIAEHKFDEAGTHEVTLTVTDEAGNTDTKSFTVDVEEKQEGSIADYWWIFPILILAGIILYQHMGQRPVKQNSSTGETIEEDTFDTTEETIEEDQSFEDEESVEDDDVFEDWEK